MAPGGEAGFTPFSHASAARINDVLRFASDLLLWLAEISVSWIDVLRFASDFLP
jgi:hypothetical protein